MGQHPNVAHIQQPEWVESSKPILTAELPEDMASGVYYLLVERQDNLATDQSYFRYTYKIINSTGIQEMSDLETNFDPGYQKVSLHNIYIIRDGKRIDKLNLDNLKVVQREAGMDKHLYDGQLTVIAHLTDIRVGDIIDYSYTVTGSNPAYQGKYFTEFSLQFNEPAKQHKYSISVPGQETINYKKLNGAKDPEIEKLNGITRYYWNSFDLQSFIYENNTPIWYDEIPSVSVSQFNSWEEVTDLFYSSYRLNDSERKKLAGKIQILLPKTKNQREFIMNSIRFVQDEVRYLGLENGLNSLIPRKPFEVLEKRYGDCKDKSFLLSEILKTQGIEASPILVHSYNGRNLTKYLPSPDVFNHCVVQIDLGQEGIFYVDPTISEQGGDLENIYFPDYQLGLVLRPGEKKLLELPTPNTFKTNINETFEIINIGGGAKLDVTTIYKGNAADLRRRLFLNANMQSLQKEFTNFYTSLYPSITAETPVKFEDDRELNIFKVHEKYHIDSIWSKSEENENFIKAPFYPLALEPYLYPTQSAGRKMPYFIDPESDIVQKTIVYVPKAWNISNQSLRFGNQYFNYKEDIRYKNATLEITHEYNTIKDHVAPQDIKSYLAEHAKMQNTLTYWLQYNVAANNAVQNSSISWPAILLMFLIFAGGGILCYFIYINYDIPTRVKARNERKIGGWLTLIGIGLAITPFRIFVQIMSSNYFSSSIWVALFSTPETSSMGVLLLIELIFNSFYFIFSIFVVILFFKRRTIAPRMAIGLFAGALIAITLITFTSLALHPKAFSGPETQALYTDLSVMAVRCLIFIPYLLYSQRVEETFTKTRKKNLNEENEEDCKTINESEQVLIQ